MIRYALKCANDHRFESWFQSAAAFDSLAAGGHLSCPVCGGSDVTKAIMAPRVASGEGAKTPAVPAVAEPVSGPKPEPAGPAPDRPLSGPPHPAEQMFKAMRAYVEKHSTYVGKRFAEEARAMHLGDRDEAPIHGEASPEEARSLIEDGVPIAPLPPGGKAN